MSTPRLRVGGLSVARGERVLLRGLDLAVPAGTFVALTGPSGVGKSSFLACLAGLLAPREGRIEYLDASGPVAPAAYRSRMALIFQHLRVNPALDAETNVLCGLLRGLPWWRTLAGFPRSLRLRACEPMERLGIAHLARVPVAELSGGERQRVALARALIAAPDVLLADEPVSQLDAALARDVIGHLRAATRESGRTVVCALHDPDLISRHADVTLRFHPDTTWTVE